MSLIKAVFEDENVLLGFTNRWGGVSQRPFADFNLASYVGDKKRDVWRNRNLLVGELGVSEKNIVWMNQMHSDKIQVATKGGEVMGTDGLVTDQTKLILMVLVADCIPILFYDLVKKVVAVVHAGRKGSFKNISRKMIAKLQSEVNSNPADIKVFLGPSIQKTCYEVDQNIIGDFKNKWGNKYIHKSRYLDLPLLNQAQLMSAGVLRKNITVSDICTHCDSNYFSYRREEKTGRFAGVVMLK
jgi:YfiH family protein